MERTDPVIDADGWRHTGDLALRQSDRHFRITGRFKDLIIRGGENIAPREIAELWYRHPKVEDVQVIGVPDRKYRGPGTARHHDHRNGVIVGH